MSFIQLMGINKTYDYPVLKNLNLSITQPGVYGLLGRNGVGKTTLIKTITGTSLPDSGIVSILGKDPVKDEVWLKKNTGYLSDDDRWPVLMSFGDLLKLYSQLHSKWDKNLEKKLISEFRLDKRIGIGAMSKGQRQMAGLVLAVCHKPKVLILDEPASGLDVIVRKKMYECLNDLAMENESCIIFASHILDDVEKLADSLIVLTDHNVALFGTIFDLLNSHTFISCDYTELESSLIMSSSSKSGNFEFIFKGSQHDAEQFATEHSLNIKYLRSPSLEELFIACSGGDV
ncbi:ABC transporter, ATP-binding protein [Lentisphaera araneosa HTCC2155]|uniref:ABC transporter, ATP-binding protein n=1 Tax=Lentisphaera araneosa HTCC2155 TaxID=313628 RepID=A6DS67_9BACT|nr:ABC transporter ATP-binding protein [Lentisphaera araneosa]EDM25527.1 ABC transporter, ATP-binding protein [Lentisphaera araneosa HTCC2155]